MTGVTDSQPTPTAEFFGTLLLSALLRRTAVDSAGQSLSLIHI